MGQVRRLSGRVPQRRSASASDDRAKWTPFTPAPPDPTSLRVGDDPAGTPRATRLRDNKTVTAIHQRITIEADKRDGKPCIRGMRITVNDVLGWLAHGMTEQEILEEHPGLEKEDFAAVYAFAADMTDAAYSRQ